MGDTSTEGNRAMRRPAAASAVLAVTASFAFAPPAPAKELTTLSVCGADGCVNRTGPLAAAKRGHDGLLDLGMGAADPGPAPFVRLRLGIGDGSGKVFGRSTMVLVPSLGLVRADDGFWYSLPPASRAFFREVARGVPRLPAAKLGPAVAAASPQPPPSGDPRPATAASRKAPSAQHGADGAVSPALLAVMAGAALAATAAAGIAWRRRRRGPQRRPAIG